MSSHRLAIQRILQSHMKSGGWLSIRSASPEFISLVDELDDYVSQQVNEVLQDAAELQGSGDEDRGSSAEPKSDEL